MRFNKITFHNYRCFIDGEIEFAENCAADRNINLILGSNGSGKTEILFSFIWTLYGFDFKTLKGKEDTPYALNADLYRKLSYSAPGSVEECWVEIELEDSGAKYFIRRSMQFEKQGNKISSRPEERIFSKELANHERSLPIRDADEIDAALQRIIPKSTLVGLVFDGERMERLSRADSRSKQTVKGVIRDVTNIELLNLSKEAFRNSMESVRRGFRGRGLSKQAIERELNELADTEIQANRTIDSLEPAREQFLEQLEEKTGELEDVKAELERNQHSRELSIEQKGFEEQRKNAQVELESAYEDLEASLSDGYLLCSSKLFKDVIDTIETCDVPEGLLASTVESILRRPKCICERPLDEETVQTLTKLMESLPPNNINSTLGEWVRSLKLSAKDVRDGAKRNSDRIRRQDEIIRKAGDNIRRISDQLAGSPIEEISSLEEQKRTLESEITRLNIVIQEAQNHINDAKKQHEHAVKRQRELSGKYTELQGTQVQMDFYEKALKAIEKIRELQEAEALARINEKLEAAYQLISEDAKRGRRLYLVQFHSQKKFQMVVYNQSAFDDRLEYMRLRGDIDKLARTKSPSEIREEIILRCADSNSGGQNKINTLAFVKAILDYSNEEKQGVTLEISKDYPLLIDAPFGDIFDDNLLLSSRELNTFAHQIILMLADQSYSNVKAQIGPHVSTVARFNKVENASRSTIGAE